MAKRNLTIQLDQEVVKRAKIAAAKRGTSVSGLVAGQLEELVASDERYEAAHRRAIELMDQVTPHGGRTWTREDLYSERLERDGRRS